MTPAPNVHASCLVLSNRGLLVVGPSGSGKTTLALALIDQCRDSGQFARLVSDDQVFIRVSGGRLIGSAPEAIAGLAEVRGLGPRPIEAESRAVIDFVVELVPEEGAPRFRDEDAVSLSGCELPRLRLAQRNTLGSAYAISAWLSRRPFL